MTDARSTPKKTTKAAESKAAESKAAGTDDAIPAPLAALAQMPALDPDLANRMTAASRACMETAIAMNQSMMQFAANRLQADLAHVRALTACKNWEAAASVQAEFLRTTAEDYQAEVAKLVDQGFQATQAMFDRR